MVSKVLLGLLSLGAWPFSGACDASPQCYKPSHCTAAGVRACLHADIFFFLVRNFVPVTAVIDELALLLSFVQFIAVIHIWAVTVLSYCGPCFSTPHLWYSAISPCAPCFTSFPHAQGRDMHSSGTNDSIFKNSKTSPCKTAEPSAYSRAYDK